MTLRARLHVAFAALAAVTALLGGTLLYSTGQEREAVRQRQAQERVSDLSHDLHEASLDLRALVQDCLLRYRPACEAEYEQTLARRGQALEALLRIEREVPEVRALEELRDLVDHTMSRELLILRRASAGDVEGGRRLFDDGYAAGQVDIQRAIETYQARELREVEALRSRAGRLSRFLDALALAAIGGAMVMAAAFAWWFGGAIARPVEELAAAIRRFGSGDSAARADIVSADELGALAGDFNRMAAGLAALPEDGQAPGTAGAAAGAGQEGPRGLTRAMQELEQAHDASLNLLEDLDRRREALERALREVERGRKHWSDAFDAVANPIFIHDKEFRIVSANRAYARCAGVPVEAVVGRPYWELFPRRDGPLPDCARLVERDTDDSGEDIALPGGQLYTSRAFAIRDDQGRYIHSIHVLEDITERRRAEEAVRRANRALKTLSACNSALVHAEDEPGLLRDICRTIVEAGGYPYVWIGYVERDGQRSVQPVAQTGFEPGFLESLSLKVDDEVRGAGPSATAVRQGTVAVTQDAVTEPALAGWRDIIVKLGISSIASFPLSSDGEVFGMLSIYSHEPNAFDRDELMLLTEMADDLNFGVIALRGRVERGRLQREHLKAAGRLKVTLAEVGRAMARAVEKRDAHAAGHQSAVADLCAAIGREMGLTDDRIEGLRLGATIHDIGTIYVPIEILNRPAALTGAEFEQVKAHPEAGYDIIKEVTFPWPVAETIYQHHEHLDGSGYPRALTGDRIILEARILAVADVVEAMLSPRPYRPAHPVDVALAEIEQHRGTWYDPAVVDACLRLFREKGFTLGTRPFARSST